MEQMKEYNFEFTKPLQLCFDLMKRCNIGFSNETVSFAMSHWRFGYMLPILIIYYITATAYMLTIFSGQVNVTELAFMVSVYLIQMQCLLKALIIFPKKRDILHLISQLGMMWRMENLTDKQINKKNSLLKRLNVSHTVFYWGSMIASFQNIMAPLLTTLFRQLILKQDCELQLPFGAVYPFDPIKNWYIYLVVFTFQAYTMLLVVFFYIATEVLMITLTAFLTIEFKLLRDDLLEVIPVVNNIETRTRSQHRSASITIEEFICHHQKLLQLSKLLDSIFNKMIFVNLLFSTVVNCFFCFAATVASDLVDIANNCLAVLALLFPVYVFCYYGDLLKGESTGIAESAYESLWYQGNSQYQRIISFIIMRSQKPCCLTSLEYTPITLNAFANVVSTTWSYFSLAISVYSEN